MVRESQEPVNMAGQKYYAIESIKVLEYHLLPDGEGDPTEVHLWFTMEDDDIPFVICFHSPGAVDELIVALMTHRKAVWG